MLSNQVLQKTIQDMKEIIGVNCSIWSMEGRCLVTTGKADQSQEQQVKRFLEEGREETCFLVKDGKEPVYILRLEQMESEIEWKMAGRLGVSQLENLFQAYKERMDKNRFFQNLLLGRMLSVDIHNQAKKLNMEVETGRAVFLIEPKKESDSIVTETLKGLYATGTKDFVTSIDESHIILVKAIEKTEHYQQLNEMAKTIVDTLNAEAMVNVRVAYGTIVSELKEIPKSYREAEMALDVGRIFYEEKNVLAYNELGIGRLIHQLPRSLCEMFLTEVFAGKAVEQFDEETLSTVAKFFENNLNISETARQLYVHRNTLVYRLEKIQKTTGLDVRVFEDALTFKIALMVADHVRFLQGRESVSCNP